MLPWSHAWLCEPPLLTLTANVPWCSTTTFSRRSCGHRTTDCRSHLPTQATCGLPCRVSGCAPSGQRLGSASRRALGRFCGAGARCLQRRPAFGRRSSSTRSTVGLRHASEALCRLLACASPARRASSSKAARGWAGFRCQLDLARPPGRSSPSCHHADRERGRVGCSLACPCCQRSCGIFRDLLAVRPHFPERPGRASLPV